MKKRTSFTDLVNVMAVLRGPGGCPWDRAQTHQSLMTYLKEETKELEKAVRARDIENLEEELGDILLQVLFHSAIASEQGEFDIFDVVDTLKHKLVNRHPHVFDRKEKNKFRTADDVRKNWNELKALDKEKRKKRRKTRSTRR